MKQVFSVLSVTCVAFFTLFLSTTNVSCKKGDTGPKGDTGNANVIYSGWLDVTYSPVTNAAGDTIRYFEATMNAPKLTDSILNKGDVRVFLNLGTAGTPEIVSIPYADVIYSYARKGAIDLQAFVNGAGTVTSGGQKYQQYRYVLIQGAVPARVATDYKSLKEAYKIPD
jgi:hypothetical protein